MQSKIFKKIFLSIFIFSILILGKDAFASTGTIDPTYHYAWGENVGFIDFIHVTVSDTTLGGSAYGENIGWIDLSTITNTNGTLGGYAWGENVGWVDFSQVGITDGVFEGQAYGENIGWISFGTTNNKVVTDWRQTTTVTPVSHTSSGSTVQSRYTNLINNGNIQEASKLAQEFPTQITSPILTPNSNNQTPIITRTLKLLIPLMKGDDVKALQTYLNAHNYNSGIVDGIFGKLTKQAVIKFQLANNLKGDGIVGPLTRAKLTP